MPIRQVEELAERLVRLIKNQMLNSSAHSLFRSLKPCSLALAALLGTSLCAQAGTEVTKDAKDKNVIQQPIIEPKFWIDLAAGGEFDIHSVKFLNDSGANFGTAAIPLPARIQSRSFESTHDAGVINGRLEVGYKVLPCMSVFAGFTYSHAGGQDDRRVGRVADPTGAAFGTPGGVYNLYADVGKYQAYSGIAGVKVNTPRYILDLIHIPKFISPYFSISGGGKYLDAQDISFYAKDGRLVNTATQNVYDDGFVFTGEAELGYVAKITRNFDITLESGYGYDTKPTHSTITGVNHANRDGDRFYSTVSLGAKLKF